jgi:uncharacterized membrane protein YgdD (TMEM256/DUF423 family)
MLICDMTPSLFRGMAPVCVEQGSRPAGAALLSDAVSFVRVAAILGFFAVALGAFGAHGLRDRFAPGGAEIWRTAALYHLVHAVALFAVALAGRRLRGGRAACWLFSGGIVVFSGSLYLMAVTGMRWLGMVTPLGGGAFLAGWLVLALTSTTEVRD